MKIHTRKHGRICHATGNFFNTIVYSIYFSVLWAIAFVWNLCLSCASINIVMQAQFSLMLLCTSSCVPQESLQLEELELLEKNAFCSNTMLTFFAAINIYSCWDEIIKFFLQQKDSREGEQKAKRSSRWCSRREWFNYKLCVCQLLINNCTN
jgi:hypothetical protein